jgi:hypothetical protein
MAGIGAGPDDAFRLPKRAGNLNGLAGHFRVVGLNVPEPLVGESQTSTLNGEERFHRPWITISPDQSSWGLRPDFLIAEVSGIIP